MWDISTVKDIGKKAFLSNYWACVVVSLILSAVLGGTGGYVSSHSHTSSTDMTYNISNVPKEVVIAAVGASLVAVIIGIVIKIFIYNPLQVGGYAFFKENVLSGNAQLDEVMQGFRDYMKTFKTLFFRDLFVLLWSLLLIIPGFMKAYSYRMVPYIISEEPDLEPSEVLAMSERMMNGHRMKAFLLDLSFLGWFLLAAVTAGVAGVFWVFPYKNNTDAALYQELREL